MRRGQAEQAQPVDDPVGDEVGRGVACSAVACVAIDLSSSHLQFLAHQLAAHRRRIGSGWRKLDPGRQALLVLAHLRCGDTYTRLAAEFGVGLATDCRYIHEVVELLAALAPDLADALKVATRKAYVILDGTLLRIDRIAADRPYYSGNTSATA